MDSLHFAGSVWHLHKSELDPALLADLLDCATPGQDAADAVARVRSRWAISGDTNDCRAFLIGYGAWDDTELACHGGNLDRLVWLTGSQLREEGDAYFEAVR